MAFPIFHNGKILFRSGTFATSTNCCCDSVSGECCISTLSKLVVAGTSVTEEVLLDDDPVQTFSWSTFTALNSGEGSITLPTNAGTGTVLIEVLARCGEVYEPVVGFELSYDKGGGFPATAPFNFVKQADSGDCGGGTECFPIVLDLNDVFAMDPADPSAFTEPDVTITFVC